MDLDTATRLAHPIWRGLNEHCHECKVAGSIRREKAEVKDIEVVAAPKWVDGAVADLFGESEQVNAAYQWAVDAEARGEVQWIKPGPPPVTPWPLKPDGKYWRGLLPGGVKLDLFLATPENFGLIYLIRTGSSDFSKAVVTHALRCGMRVAGGQLLRSDEVIPTPTEESVFEALGLAYVSPRNRTDGSVLRKAATQAARKISPCSHTGNTPRRCECPSDCECWRRTCWPPDADGDTDGCRAGDGGE